MGARPYIPALGRFLQVDPIEGGVDNDYGYPSNPVSDVDLDGRFALALAPVLAFGGANAWNPAGWVVLGATVVGGAAYLGYKLYKKKARTERAPNWTGSSRTHKTSGAAEAAARQQFTRTGGKYRPPGKCDHHHVDYCNGKEQVKHTVHHRSRSRKAR